MRPVLTDAGASLPSPAAEPRGGPPPMLTTTVSLISTTTGISAPAVWCPAALAGDRTDCTYGAACPSSRAAPDTPAKRAAPSDRLAIDSTPVAFVFDRGPSNSNTCFEVPLPARVVTFLSPPGISRRPV